MPTDQQTFRAELIGLLRGYFACPVLATLADLGLTKKIRSGLFRPDDLPAANRPALLAALCYLQSLGGSQEQAPSLAATLIWTAALFRRFFSFFSPQTNRKKEKKRRKSAAVQK